MFGNQSRLRTRPGIEWLIYPLLAFVLWVVAREIASENIQVLAMVALGLSMLGIAAKIIRDWRSGLYLFLVWLLFEDFARKYLGNGTALFFGKDVLLAMVCYSFLMEQRHKPVSLFRPPFFWGLGLFTLLAVGQVFNPNSPSIFYGLIGLKIYFYYIPLMFLGYALVRSKVELDRFLIINLALAAVIAGLGIAQSIRGPEFLNPATLAPELNLGKLTRASPITSLQVLRPSSVFVSTGRFTAYMVQAFIVGFGATVYLFLRGKRSWSLALTALAIVALGGIMGGSRGCVGWIAISAVILSAVTMWGLPGMSSKSLALRRMIRKSAVILGIGLFLSTLIFPNQLKAYFAVYTESLDPRNSESDLVNRLGAYPLNNLLDAFTQPNWLLGNGTGTASLGAQYVARLLGTPQPDVGVEEGFGTLMLEMGIIAPFLWLWWTASATGSCFKTTLALKGSSAFPLAFAVFWFVFILLLVGTWGGMAQYENFVSNAYLWLLLGILFRLPTLDREGPEAVNFEIVPSRYRYQTKLSRSV